MPRRVLFALLSAGGCVPQLYTTVPPEPVNDWDAPVNSWTLSEPPPGLAPEGYEVGQVVPDLRLPDQFGEEVALWQFYGSVVLIDIATLWCAPCQALAEDAEETWEDYRDQGFVYLTVMQENLEGDPPEPEDIELWVENYALTSPVLADGDKVAWDAIKNNAYPAVLLIGRDLVVAERIDPPTAETVREAIEGAL